MLEEILSPLDTSDRNNDVGDEFEFDTGNSRNNYLKKRNLGGCCRQSTLSMDEYDYAHNKLLEKLEELDDIIKEVGDHHISSAHQKALIADSYAEIMDHQRAISYYEDSRNIYVNNMGKNCPEAININMKLGKSYYMNANFEKSLKAYHEGLDMMANEREHSTNCEN